MSSVVKQQMNVLKLFWVTAGSIHFFQIRSQESLRIIYPKYPVLDMIQGIHLSCGSFGSIIHFWILVLRNKMFIFGLKIQIWILLKKRTRKLIWDFSLSWILTVNIDIFLMNTFITVK